MGANNCGGEPKRLTLLGSTGSIGQSTLDVVRHDPSRFDIEALVANRNIAQLAKDAREFDAKLAVTADAERYDELKSALSGSGIEAAAGIEAVVEAAARPVDMIMAAIVGADGLRPTLSAVRQGTTIGLANKECLVSAGELFMATAGEFKAEILPVDSEHSAIFQCFEERNAAHVHNITLTASGGPFRNRTLKELGGVLPCDALKHPNWDMGPKVTIDSATLMNKGLELIEAFHLFPVNHTQLDAIIHPQSIVHSFVSYIDGSVLAQLGVPDMRTPIAVALAHPARIPAPVETLNLTICKDLTFEAVDAERFPSVNLCLGALERGGTATTILNAANEVAVAEFLSQNLGFIDITALVDATLNTAERDSMITPIGSLDDVWAADAYGRRIAKDLAHKLQS